MWMMLQNDFAASKYQNRFVFPIKGTELLKLHEVPWSKTVVFLSSLVCNTFRSHKLGLKSICRACGNAEERGLKEIFIIWDANLS